MNNVFYKFFIVKKVNCANIFYLKYICTNVYDRYNKYISIIYKIKYRVL